MTYAFESLCIGLSNHRMASLPELILGKCCACCVWLRCNE